MAEVHAGVGQLTRAALFAFVMSLRDFLALRDLEPLGGVDRHNRMAVMQPTYMKDRLGATPASSAPIADMPLLSYSPSRSENRG